MTAKRIDIVFDVVFSMLLFSLSISTAIPNILLGVLVFIFFLKSDKIIYSKTYVKLISLFVFYFLLKALFFNTFIENLSTYKFLFILLALSFLMFNVKNIITLINGYIWGVLLAVLISSIKIVLYFLEHANLPFGNTGEVQSLILIHRPYFGFMCLLSIILIDYLFFKSDSKSKKIIYLIIVTLIITFLYIIVARLSLFLLLIYIIIRLLFYLKFSKVKSFLSVLTFFLLLFSVFNINDNIKNRLHIKSSYNETIKVLRNQEARFVIWQCNLNQIKEKSFNFFFGYKNRKVIQEKLNNCYNGTINNVSKKNYYLKTVFNSHNQFFDFFLEGGIFGLILFLLVLFFSMYSFRHNFFALFSVFSFFLFLLIENIFHRQLGVFIFGIFIPLLSRMITFNKNDKEG